MQTSPSDTTTTLSYQRERKLCNRVSGVLLAYLLLMNLVVIAVMLVEVCVELIRLTGLGYNLNAALNQVMQPDFLTQLLQNGAGYLVVSGLCLLLILLWKKPAFYREVFRPGSPMSGPVFWQLLSVFLSIQVLSSLFFNLLESILNLWGLSANQAGIEISEIVRSPGMILYVAVVAPVVEELLFRGAVLRSFQPFGKRFAIVFSALLFGLFHGNLIQIPFAFLTGLVLGYTAVEYSIVWAMLLHFINNGIFSLLLSPAPMLQNLLMVGFLIAGVVAFAIHGNDVRAYHRNLYPMPRQALRGFWTAPCTIILALLCLLSAAMGIQAQWYHTDETGPAAHKTGPSARGSQKYNAKNGLLQKRIFAIGHLIGLQCAPHMHRLAALGHRATISFSALPALNTGKRAAGISMGSPVEGLRPVRASRSLVSKVPNPTSWTRSPAASALVMLSKAAAKARSVSFLERPDRSTMAEISSVLFMLHCLFPG